MGLPGFDRLPLLVLVEGVILSSCYKYRLQAQVEISRSATG